MLPTTLIADETQDPLTSVQVLALQNLVKEYRAYRAAIGRWPQLSLKLEAERVAPTVKTQALKAVLTLLEDVPAISVQSEGSDEAKSYYATLDNRELLAQEVLNTLYEIPITVGQSTYVLVQRKIGNLNLIEYTDTSNKDLLGSMRKY